MKMCSKQGHYISVYKWDYVHNVTHVLLSRCRPAQRTQYHRTGRKYESPTHVFTDIIYVANILVSYILISCSSIVLNYVVLFWC
jgi:hypothetical protein